MSRPVPATTVVTPLVLGLALWVAGSLSAGPEEAPLVEEPLPTGIVWLEDELPADAQMQGTWIWDEELKASGTRSHGHPPAPGAQGHGFTAEPITLPLNGRVLQQVWLDPQDPPEGIAVRFKLPTGEEVGVYWEGEKEVFTPGDYEELWYYGILPELGVWVDLEILAEDLGLEEEQVVGMNFMTYGGRVLWDRTVVSELPAEEAEAPAEEPRPEPQEQTVPGPAIPGPAREE